MKCKDCKYLHFNKSTGYTRAFCSHYESDKGEIKAVIRKCKHYASIKRK